MTSFEPTSLILALAWFGACSAAKPHIGQTDSGSGADTGSGRPSPWVAVPIEGAPFTGSTISDGDAWLVGPEGVFHAGGDWTIWERFEGAPPGLTAIGQYDYTGPAVLVVGTGGTLGEIVNDAYRSLDGAVTVDMLDIDSRSATLAVGAGGTAAYFGAGMSVDPFTVGTEDFVSCAYDDHAGSLAISRSGRIYSLDTGNYVKPESADLGRIPADIALRVVQPSDGTKSDSIWVAGSGGAVWGGATFDSFYSFDPPTTGDLYSIAFMDASRITGGAEGILWERPDDTWIQAGETPDHSAIRTIAADYTSAIAAGDGDYVMIRR